MNSSDGKGFGKNIWKVGTKNWNVMGKWGGQVSGIVTIDNNLLQYLLKFTIMMK